MTKCFAIVAGAIALALSAVVNAEGPPAMPAFHEDGTVSVPAFDLPPSELMSDEAKAMQRMRAKYPVPISQSQEPDIATRRAQIEAMMAPRVAEMFERYPADITDTTIGGIPVKIITPKGGKADPKRVLINLHGGGFTLCWPGCALLESIPIAVLGGYKVVSVNYRMAPEFAHPAGVEDAGAVYSELLKAYKPKRIGVFGCSAGGALTAQLASWLPANGLPQAGAVGIFGAGGVRFSSGDSAYVTAYIDGSFPAPRPGQQQYDLTRGYFAAVDGKDPIVSPALHAEVMAKFPPTLLITGTRAMDMSPAVYTNSQLLKAGMRSTLIVGEGMGHCYTYSAQLPEAQDAYAATVAFFRENLR